MSSGGSKNSLASLQFPPSPPNLLPFCSLSRFHFQFGCFLAAGRGEAKQSKGCVQSEAARKLRARVCPCGLDCANLSSVRVCVPHQQRIKLVSDPVVDTRNASVVFLCVCLVSECTRLVGWEPANAIGIGLDAAVQVFTVSLTFPRVFPQAMASGGCGYYPPPSAVRRPAGVPCVLRGTNGGRPLARRVAVGRDLVNRQPLPVQPMAIARAILVPSLSPTSVSSSAPPESRIPCCRFLWSRR